MPRTKSAKKALRQNLRRKTENLGKKRNLKATIKKYERLILSRDLVQAEEYLPTLYKTLDKAGQSRIVEANKSNRLKSRLTRQLRRAKSVSASS